MWFLFDIDFSGRKWCYATLETDVTVDEIFTPNVSVKIKMEVCRKIDTNQNSTELSEVVLLVWKTFLEK